MIKIITLMEDKTKAALAILLNKYCHKNVQYWTAFNVQYADIHGIQDALIAAEIDGKLSESGKEWIGKIRKDLGL